MLIEINLPVSSSIKEFLVSKFGAEYHTNNRDWFGLQILSLLERKSSVEGVIKSPKKDKLSEVYKIKVRLSHIDKYGIIITPYKEEMLRRFIESVFRDACFDFALMSKDLYNMDYKNSIANFLGFYNISQEEGSYFDALVRDFNRKKMNRQQKNTLNLS